MKRFGTFLAVVMLYAQTAICQEPPASALCASRPTPGCLFDEALAQAGSEADLNKRFSALGVLALREIEAGKFDTAGRALAILVKVLEEIHTEERRVAALVMYVSPLHERLADRAALARIADRAALAAVEMRAGESRTYFLMYVVHARMRAGDLPGARAAAAEAKLKIDEIANERDRKLASQRADELALIVGEPGAALRIDDASERGAALLRVAAIRAQGNDAAGAEAFLAEALAVLNLPRAAHTPMFGWRSSILISAARIKLILGDRQAAISLARQAIADQRSVSAQSPRVNVYPTIAKVLTDAGAASEAVALADTLPPSEVEWIYRDAALAMLDHDLDGALRAARGATPRERIRLLGEAARRMPPGQARSILDEAAALAAQLPGHENLFAMIARAHAQIGNAASARWLIKTYVPKARSIAEPHSRVLALRDWVAVLIAAGDKRGAVALSEEILEAARAVSREKQIVRPYIGQWSERDEALKLASGALAETGNLTEARVAALSIESSLVKAEALALAARSFPAEGKDLR